MGFSLEMGFSNASKDDEWMADTDADGSDAEWRISEVSIANNKSWYERFPAGPTSLHNKSMEDWALPNDGTSWIYSFENIEYRVSFRYSLDVRC